MKASTKNRQAATLDQSHPNFTFPILLSLSIKCIEQRAHCFGQEGQETRVYPTCSERHSSDDITVLISLNVSHENLRPQASACWLEMLTKMAERRKPGLQRRKQTRRRPPPCRMRKRKQKKMKLGLLFMLIKQSFK